jgi:3-hydroxyisobutyrate dehydrogenase-like beta-hydroxyacid dehydrogenase
MTLNVGFAGIGDMGLPMAHCLVDQGFSLTVFNRSRQKLDPLVQRGVRVANSPAELASATPIVMVCLATPDVVREVALGPQGIIEGSAVKIFVDLSTTGSSVAQQVSSALGAKGITALDAPVSGGVPGAQKGTLTVMVSGPRLEFQQVQPVLEAIGKKISYVGEKPGLAQMLKLVNNLLSATAVVITSEACVLGVKAGLDAEVMLDIINSSSGRNTATADKFPRVILPRTFDSGFKSELMYKDIKLCLDEAEALGVPMWVANAVRQLWAYAISQGGGSRDASTIIQYIEAWAGVKVAAS